MNHRGSEIRYKLSTVFISSENVGSSIKHTGWRAIKSAEIHVAC